MKLQKPTASTAPEPGGLATITSSLEIQSVFSQGVALVGRPPSSEQGHTDTHDEYTHRHTRAAQTVPDGFSKDKRTQSGLRRGGGGT